MNRATPIVNIRLRPKRSPSAAPVSSRTANVSVYALTVHSSWDSDASRLCLMTGSAVVTTRLSSEVMNSASEVIAKVAIDEPSVGDGSGPLRGTPSLSAGSCPPTCC